MRVHTNTALIRRRLRLSVAYLAVSMALLVGGFIASINIQDLALQYAISLPTLVVGLLFWWRNQIDLRRFGPRGRQDPLLARTLRGLDDHYHLFVFAANGLPDYVLLGPMGLLALIPRAVTGSVTCYGGQWRHETGRPPLLRAFLWFLPATPLGNPRAEARRAIDGARRYLAGNPAAEHKGHASIDALVVFTDPRVKLVLQGCQTPAVTVRSLRAHVRRLPRSLGAREVETLAATLGA